MAIERWNPSRTYSRQEEFLLKRLRRTRKLFAFLRDHRHEIFDDAMQAALESMYRDTGAGKEPVCPAMMSMAALMQGYLGVSDAEAVGTDRRRPALANGARPLGQHGARLFAGRLPGVQ